jgi:hypothetical protein
MGDAIEGYWIDDPRYTPATLKADPLAQQKSIEKILENPAKYKRLITLMYGNHEHALLRKVGNITRSTCEHLNIPYGGFTCVVSFADKFGTQFKGFFTHGRKLIRSIADDPLRRIANEKLQLKQHLKNKAGDCLIMAKGHTHRLIVAEPQSQLFLVTDPDIKQKYTHNPPFGKGGYIHPDHRWYINTGSYLRTFGEGVESYSELGEYDPIEMGYVIVKVEDRQVVDVKRVVL